MQIMIMFMLLAVTISSVAQEKKDHKKFDKEKMERCLPSITRSLGGSIQSFNGLNNRLAGLPQYKQLKDYTATLGLGWMMERNRFISGTGITIGSSLSAHRDEKSSTIRYIGFNADMGYDLLKNEKITLYPLAGLGYQAYQAIFYSDNTAVDFDDVLESPAVQNSIRSTRFRNDFLLYRAGFGVAFQSPEHAGSIGLQAGYTGSFQKHGWRSNEGQTLGNAPKDGISQFYFSLILTSRPWMMKKMMGKHNM